VEKIAKSQGKLYIPDHPAIPFVEGDGIGPDIWRAASSVINAAVQKAYGGRRSIEWMEVLAGQRAFEDTGSWLPDRTVDVFREHLVGIKGPLTTPVGGGIRSLNVALRQRLDLYACVRPVRYFPGVPSPVRHPEWVDMVVFRENTEDVYAGLELQEGTPEAARLMQFLRQQFGWKLREDSGVGLKPISRTGSERLVRSAIEHAIRYNRKSVTLVHKGNIQKYTEGAFREWGYQLAEREFADTTVSWEQAQEHGSDGRVLIKDAIADIFLQQILTRPREFAPGANINFADGTAIFEATHGTAPKYAGKNVVNPSSLILSGAMMLEYIGWSEAADLIEKGTGATIEKKRVTYDFARLMEGATKVSTSDFARIIIENMA
jgi:isocitrate dehydrogenase